MTDEQITRLAAALKRTWEVGDELRKALLELDETHPLAHNSALPLQDAMRLVNELRIAREWGAKV